MHDIMQNTSNVADILSDTIVIVVYIALLSAGAAAHLTQLCLAGSCLSTGG